MSLLRHLLFTIAATVSSCWLSPRRYIAVADDAVPMDPQGFVAEFISVVPRIALYRSFLSPSECDGLVALATNHSAFSPNTHGLSSVYLPIYPKLPPFAQAIERRIGAVTGYPPHPDEEPLNIHRIAAVAAAPLGRTAGARAEDHGRACIAAAAAADGATAETCGLSVTSVHHDKVQKEYSSVTVLAYLADVDVGGGTVWPCLMRYDNTSGTAPAPASHHAQPAAACDAAFAMRGRWFDGTEAVAYQRFQKHRAAPALHAALQDVLLASHYGCLFDGSPEAPPQPAWIATGALRTTARKGDAIVFFHDHMDLTGDAQAWHAGCVPRSGDKWTMQKFKELPVKYRPAADRVRQHIYEDNNNPGAGEL